MEQGLPLQLVLLLVGEDISWECLKLSDLVLDFLVLGVNLFGITGDCFQIWSQDRVKLLNDDAGLLKILEDVPHVAWSTEDLFGLLEVPSLDGLLSLDLPPGRCEFLPPFLKHSLALLDDLNGFVWWLLEDLGDVNLGLDLVTDLI